MFFFLLFLGTSEIPNRKRGRELDSAPGSAQAATESGLAGSLAVVSAPALIAGDAENAGVAKCARGSDGTVSSAESQAVR